MLSMLQATLDYLQPPASGAAAVAAQPSGG